VSMNVYGSEAASAFVETLDDFPSENVGADVAEPLLKATLGVPADRLTECRARTPRADRISWLPTQS
jgi:hypothetical protein